MIIVSATSAPVFWQVHEKLFKFSLLSDTTDRSMILLAETMIMAEKYNRFSAFRREVKSVVMHSDLLEKTGFLT